MTRIKTVQEAYDKKGALPTGVDGQNIPEKFYIPPVNIRDVDKAVFDLFSKRLKLTTTTKQQTSPVPVIVAGGERFALLKRNRPLRDKTGTLVLPLVAIRRTGIEQSKIGVIRGKGMGQDTGEIVIKRRLSRKDSRYQSLINKLHIRHQDNVASPENVLDPSANSGAVAGTVATRRLQASSIDRTTGDILEPDLNKNIFEIITIPFPRFYTALYEITLWAQYNVHMNQMLETFMTSYDAQGNQFRLDTDKGYWFVGYVDDEFSSGDNFDDYSEKERIIRYTITMKVPAYLMAAEKQGSGVPFRSYLSAPQVSFQIAEAPPLASLPKGAPVGSGDVSKFMLRDVSVLDKQGDPVEDTRQQVLKTEEVVRDPFSGEDVVRYLRVLDKSNRKGERLVSKRFILPLDDVEF